MKKLCSLGVLLLAIIAPASAYGQCSEYCPCGCDANFACATCYSCGDACRLDYLTCKNSCSTPDCIADCAAARTECLGGCGGGSTSNSSCLPSSGASSDSR